MELPADWTIQLEERGFAELPKLLTAEECSTVQEYWNHEELFRNEVAMERHGYGRGTYRYFANPLPDPIALMRQALYPPLAEVANLWHERLGIPTSFPSQLEDLLARCRQSNQNKPTPLLLRYDEADYNRLHQDRYGEIAFPLQIAVLLSRPGSTRDFTGGEFLIQESRPRMQSKGSVAHLAQGDAVLFPNQYRPIEGRRGPVRVAVRHGVSEVRSGTRMALGIIFHDAA